MITEREKFTAVVLSAPLMKADAIVVCAGEDGENRLAIAQDLMRQGAAEFVVLSGGLDGKDKKSAKTLASSLMGRGVSPDRIIEDNESTNTAEQSRNVIAMARKKGWRQLLLVASGYHMPRAFLSFVNALNGDAIRIVPVTANQVPWWGKPEGVQRNRLELLEGEYAKIAAYQELGDVASYEQGLKHLKKWEGK